MPVSNAILAALPKELGDELACHARRVVLIAGQVLIEEGEIPEVVYFPVTTVLACTRWMEDGHIVQLAAVGRFESAGGLACLTDSPASAHLVVQLGGSAITIPCPVLKRMAHRSPDFLSAIARSAESVAKQAESNLACNAHHDTTRRLARWLLMLSDRTGEDLIALTQENMAVMAGVQRTTVNASAMTLKDAMLIRYGRGHIHILDRRGLETAACSCYRDFAPLGAQRAPAEPVFEVQ